MASMTSTPLGKRSCTLSLCGATAPPAAKQPAMPGSLKRRLSFGAPMQATVCTPQHPSHTGTPREGKATLRRCMSAQVTPSWERDVAALHPQGEVVQAMHDVSLVVCALALAHVVLQAGHPPTRLSVPQTMLLVDGLPNQLQHMRSRDKDWLRAAARGQCDALVTMLRGHGARALLPVRHRATGYTALHYATLGGHVQAARILLAAGACPGALARGGVVAVDLARRRGHGELVQLLTAATLPSTPNWARRHSCPAAVGTGSTSSAQPQASALLRVDVKVHRVLAGPWYHPHSTYRVCVSRQAPTPTPTYRTMRRFTDFARLHTRLLECGPALPLATLRALTELQPRKNARGRFRTCTLTQRAALFQRLILLAAADSTLNAVLTAFLVQSNRTN